MEDQMAYENKTAGPDGGCSACEFRGVERNGITAIPYTAELRELLASLFTEEYMRTHTRFESFDAFRYSSAVIVNWDQDFLIYRNDLFDNFVRESTEFSSWDEMIASAAASAFAD